MNETTSDDAGRREAQESIRRAAEAQIAERGDDSPSQHDQAAHDELLAQKPQTIDELWDKLQRAVARITRLEEEVSRMKREEKQSAAGPLYGDGM